MSLARAFTTRKRANLDLQDGSALPQRSNTTKVSSNQIRNKISSPVQLVHTTNMLSYNAPDLPRPSLAGFNVGSGPASTKSEDDSDTLNTVDSTPPTSPDVAPGERCPSPVPNHLSTYFMAPFKPLTSAAQEAPVIPQRSPSHTKKASYDAINRQRSLSRISKASDNSLSSKSSMTFSRSSSTSTSMSHMSTHSRKMSAPPRPPPLSPVAPIPAVQSHPFGQELAQVTELVEELSVKKPTKAMEEDEKYITSKGLARFGVNDYLNMVDDIATSFFPDTNHIRAAGPMWI